MLFIYNEHDVTIKMSFWDIEPEDWFRKEKSLFGSRKSSSPSQSHLDYPDVSLDDNNILVSGDYYFYNFLSSKVKLTDLGIYILETIKAEN